MGNFITSKTKSKPVEEPFLEEDPKLIHSRIILALEQSGVCGDFSEKEINEAKECIQNKGNLTDWKLLLGSE